MACKYFANNGKPSKLYEDVMQKHGAAIATKTWDLVRTPAFKNAYGDLPVDSNAEITIESLERLDIITTLKSVINKPETTQTFRFRAEKLQQAFKDAGVEIDLVENLDLENTAQVEGKVLQYNPNKIQQDSVYHEFGHILIDAIGYSDPLIQNAVRELSKDPLKSIISILNPELSSERLNKEVLASKLGIEANKEVAGRTDGFRFYYNMIVDKLKILLGIETSAVEQLVKQLSSKKITSKLNGKLELYVQAQKDMRLIGSVFVTKQDVLEKAIIKIEQKMRDYFVSIEPELRYGNPIYRDFINLSAQLKEYRKTDIDRGIIEFLTFAYIQTQQLEERIDSIKNPDRPGTRPVIEAGFLRDLLNYNEAFGDVMEDLQSVINSNYLLKQTLENHKSTVDESILSYVPKIRERYEKVKRTGKQLSLEHVANLMLNTGENNKFIQHLRNSLKRQWAELPGNQAKLLDSKNIIATRKEQDLWADSEIEKLKDWQNQSEYKDNGELVSEGGDNQLTSVTKRYYLNLLQQTANDIGWFERWLLAGNMINDEIIQYGSELLDKADYKTRIATIQEFRDVGDLVDRYNKEHSTSKQVDKYADLLEDEVDDALAITGKKRQYLVGKYNSKFFELKSAKYKVVAEAKETFGEDSPEHEVAYKEYQQFLDDNTVRPYNDEYYRIMDSLPDYAKKATAPLKAQKKAILTRYATNAKNTVYNLTNITDEDAEKMKLIERQLKEMSSMHDKQGVLKTGQPLKIAEALIAHNKLLNEMYTEGVFQKEEFDKAWAKAIGKKKGDEFIAKNTYTGIKAEFWDDFKKAFEGNSDRDEINSILANYKGQNGDFYIDELDEELIGKLKNLYNALPKGTVKERDWFEDNVSITPRAEYTVKLAEMEKMRDDGSISEKVYQQWFTNNHLIDIDGNARPLPFWTKLEPKTMKYFEKKYNKYWYTADVRDQYKNQNLKEGEVVGGLKDKWRNPQYDRLQAKGGVTLEMYNHLIQSIEEADKPIYYDYRLTTVDGAGNKYYKLPSVIKHKDTEIYGDDGVTGVFRNKWERIKAALAGKKEDSMEFGGDILTALYEESNNVLLVQADEQGKERHRVPVNLRTPIAVEDQSFDLPSIMLLNRQMARNFENKKDIQHELEIMGDVLSERKIVETEGTPFKGVKSKVNNLLGAVGMGMIPITKSGADSNSYKAFVSMLESRLYGIKNKGSVQAHQIAGVLTKYTGATALALNIYSAGSNLVSGRLQNYINATGGQFVGFKDIGFARLELNKQAASLFADTSARVPSSKIGRLLERINPKSDWIAIDKTFAVGSGLKRIYETVDLNVLNSIGETLIQSTMMLAVLNNAKALNKDGQYIDKDGHVVQKELAMSMYEAYNNDPKELIKPMDIVGGFEINGKRILEPNYEFYLSYFVRELNKNLQGDYDVNNISEARRTVIGKLALVLRRWYPSTLKRRIRGVSKVGKNAAELDADESYYNRATREEEEGYYTTFLRYGYQVIKEAKRLKFEQGRGIGAAVLESMKSNYARTLKYERTNLGQVFGEASATFIYLGLSTMLYTLGKDIDKKDKVAKKSFYMMSFWLLRAQRELTSYYNPAEILRTVGSPSVILKQAKEMIDVVTAIMAEAGNQFSEPFTLRRYETGRRKGDSKTFKEISDVVPLLKQLDKTVEEQLSYMSNVKGF